MARPKGKTAKGGRNGDKKHGRMKNKPAYQRYLLNEGRAKKKAKKIFLYMKKFPNWEYTEPPERTDEPKLANNVHKHLKRLLKG